MDLNLKGKKVLVTGGSKGIGRACAEAFAAEGAKVKIASRNPQAGPDAKAIDISQRGAAETLAQWAGELDIVVNNAGAIPGGDLLKVDEETWRRAWELKVFGYINLTRAVYAGMKQRKRGLCRDGRQKRRGQSAPPKVVADFHIGDRRRCAPRRARGPELVEWRNRRPPSKVSAPGYNSTA